MATHDYDYPRPWAWNDVSEGRQGQLLVHDANGQIVAWIGDMEVTGGADIDNAALISAAPDLLLACELVKGWIDMHDVTCGPVVWAELNRAITKAKEFAKAKDPENVDTSF